MCVVYALQCFTWQILYELCTYSSTMVRRPCTHYIRSAGRGNKNLISAIVLVVVRWIGHILLCVFRYGCMNLMWLLICHNFVANLPFARTQSIIAIHFLFVFVLLPPSGFLSSSSSYSFCAISFVNLQAKRRWFREQVAFWCLALFSLDKVAVEMNPRTKPSTRLTQFSLGGRSYCVDWKVFRVHQMPHNLSVFLSRIFYRSSQTGSDLITVEVASVSQVKGLFMFNNMSNGNETKRIHRHSLELDQETRTN